MLGDGDSEKNGLSSPARILFFFSHVALHFGGSVSFLKKFLFLASLLKLNAFHWHFADDQAVQVLLHTKARLHH